MSNLILRSNAPKRVMTFELKRRGHPTVVEWLRLSAGPLSILLGAVAAIGMIATETTAGGVAGGILLAVDLVALIVWLIALSEDNVMSLTDRRFQVMAGRSRRKRAHAAIEQTRLRALRRKYARYSVWVDREKTSVRVQVLRHDPRDLGLFLRWHATTQKRGYDVENDTWNSGTIARWDVTEPTPDRIMAAVERAQETAEAMEEADYASALNEHKVEAMVRAYQPPPAGAKSRERVLQRLSE